MFFRKRKTPPAPPTPVERIEADRNRLTDIRDDRFWELALFCAPHSLLTTEKFYNLYASIEHIVRAGVPGDIVECGVWKGGAMMLAALLLNDLGATDRTIYLYDTFAGFTDKSKHDVLYTGKPIFGGRIPHFRSQVEANMAKTLYPAERIRLVEGDVRDTVRAGAHEAIAYLRLDTDTYSSTLHELRQFYAAVPRGGVVTIDDYGYSLGCRKAFHEFFDDGDRLLWQRPNRGARTAIKL